MTSTAARRGAVASISTSTWAGYARFNNADVASLLDKAMYSATRDAATPFMIQAQKLALKASAARHCHH